MSHDPNAPIEAEMVQTLKDDNARLEALVATARQQLIDWADFYEAKRAAPSHGYVYILQERPTQAIIGVFSTLQRAKIAGRDCDIDPTTWEAVRPCPPVTGEDDDTGVWFASDPDGLGFIVTLSMVDE